MAIVTSFKVSNQLISAARFVLDSPRRNDSMVAAAYLAVEESIYQALLSLYTDAEYCVPIDVFRAWWDIPLDKRDTLSPETQSMLDDAVSLLEMVHTQGIHCGGEVSVEDAISFLCNTAEALYTELAVGQ